VKYGVCIDGPDPKTLIDFVSTDEIRAGVRDLLYEWWFPMLADPGWLTNYGSEYHAYAVISMCRSLHALEHGTIVSKPAATRWAADQFPGWKWLIEKANNSQEAGGAEFVGEALQFMEFTKKIVEGKENDHISPI
jgi:hypothetical protein